MKIFLIACFICFAGLYISSTQAVTDSGWSYHFHLYYDSGKLYTDRDVKFKYDVIPEKLFAKFRKFNIPTSREKLKDYTFDYSTIFTDDFNEDITIDTEPKIILNIRKRIKNIANKYSCGQKIYSIS